MEAWTSVSANQAAISTVAVTTGNFSALGDHDGNSLQVDQISATRSELTAIAGIKTSINLAAASN